MVVSDLDMNLIFAVHLLKRKVVAPSLEIVYRRDCLAGSAARVNASVAQPVPAVEMNWSRP
jgi:hypothetical protein